MKTVAQGITLTKYIEEKEFMKIMMENWRAMHTPKVRKFRKVGCNEICPFCDSGLKFKYCECSIKEEYEEYKGATR